VQNIEMSFDTEILIHIKSIQRASLMDLLRSQSMKWSEDHSHRSSQEQGCSPRDWSCEHFVQSASLSRFEKFSQY